MLKLLTSLCLAVLFNAGCRPDDASTSENKAFLKHERQHPSLENTHWVLTAIKGRPAESSGRQSFIELQPKLVRFVGDTGINTISGTYSKTDHQLRFTIEVHGQSTGSDEATAQDHDLAYVLATTQTYRVEGRELSLLVDDQVAALFVAQ